MSSKLIVTLSTVLLVQQVVVQAAPKELVQGLQQLKQSCIAISGSEEGYQQIVESVQPIKTCVLNQIDMVQLQVDLAQMGQSGRKEFFGKYCPQFNQTVNCLDGAFKGLAKCGARDPVEVIPYLTEAFHGVLEVICQNDGQFFFDVQKREFADCVVILQEIVAECKSGPSTRFDDAEKRCRAGEAHHKCTSKKLETCSTRGIHDVADVMFKLFVKANSCQKVLDQIEAMDNTIDGA